MKRYTQITQEELRDRTSIEERPTIVEERARIGDWEVDTVIGKPGGAVSVILVERASRLSRVALAHDKTEVSMKQAILEVMQPVMAHLYTLTYDNGKEFACHV